MICLLILLERGRCWLWDTRNTSNTSRPIWVYKYVFMHMYVISVTSEAIVVFKQPLRSMFTMNLSCITELPAYSDSVWNHKRCHCNQIVTISNISVSKHLAAGICYDANFKADLPSADPFSLSAIFWESFLAITTKIIQNGGKIPGFQTKIGDTLVIGYCDYLGTLPKGNN